MCTYLFKSTGFESWQIRGLHISVKASHKRNVNQIPKPQKPKKKKKDPHSRKAQIHKHTLFASLSMAKVNRLPVPLIGWCVCETMLCFPDPSCGATAQQVETGGKRECRKEKKRKENVERSGLLYL